MAITVTTILGTDSLTASRPIINDNFNILKDEINAIEAYVDPAAGTISGLTSIQSVSELRVGPIGNYYLELTPNAFNISTGVSFTSSSAVNEMAGIFSHNSFTQLSSVITGNTATISPTAGSRYYYIVHATGNSTYDIQVNAGYFGQEITLYCEQITTGTINITNSGSSTFVFGPTYTNNNAAITEAGANITLAYLRDSAGNAAWYPVSYHNVTLS